MDRSLIVLSIFLFLTFGCAKQSEDETKIFPVMSIGCEETAHKTRYIVKKQDGSIIKVHADSREEMLNKYVRPNIKDLIYVERDQIIYANDVVEVNDIFSEKTWGSERINAQAAWDKNIKGSGVIVAVIDSGVEISHSSLKSQTYVNTLEKNGLPLVDDDGNGYVDDFSGWDFSMESPYNNDTSGHGTHVAGIIAGAHTGEMKGVAPEAKILPLDFMDNESGYTSDAIEAISYAKSMNARVINASWGSSFCSKLLNDSIDSLAEKNILFVAAAGNNGNDLSYYPEFPAAFVSPAQISVGSITRNGFMSYFSNYGALVDVMAPGDEIYSTYLNDGYISFSGTSMAAPFVSGLAALLVSKNPTLTVHELKSIIMNSVTPGNFPVKTRGEINVPQALTLLN